MIAKLGLKENCGVAAGSCPPSPLWAMSATGPKSISPDRTTHERIGGIGSPCLSPDSWLFFRLAVCRTHLLLQ